MVNVWSFKGTYMVVYRQNLANMLHNSMIMQSLLRIKKKYKNFQVKGHFAHKCKTSGGICKTSCSLTEKFDRGDKLINVVQFQGGNWSFVNFRGVIDETYNFRRVIDYLLILYSSATLHALLTRVVQSIGFLLSMLILLL